MGRIEEAKQRYEKALEMRQKLLKTDPENVTYQSDVATTLNNLGTLLSEKGQKEEAKKNFKKALEILETLSKKDPENKKLKEELSFTQENLEIALKSNP